MDTSSLHFSGTWSDDERQTIADALAALGASVVRGALRGPEWTCYCYASLSDRVFAASHNGSARMITAASADELAGRLRTWSGASVTPLARAA
jgi:hypothetical protein